MTGIAYDKESKTEITDEGRFDVLHMHGFPADIVPAINKYNREHRGPDGNAINISQTCIDALRSELKKREINNTEQHQKAVLANLETQEKCLGALLNELKKRDHPLKSMTHIPNVGPVELKRAAELIKGMGSRPPKDIDGNRLEIGDKVGFTIAGPDANNYLQGKVCRRDNGYWVYCGTPGLIKIDNDLLNLHKLTDEPGLKSPECSVCDEVADDRAQTRSVMGYTDKSIWLCPRCVTAITNMEYVHLNRNGLCDECDSVLEQYEKVEWRT